MKKKKILIGALLATAVIGVSSCSKDVIPTTPTPPTESQEPEVIKKTISFDSQGGSSVISISVKVGDKVTRPNNPEKVGYTFSGWYKESSCVNEWNFETETISDDITLYAKWISNENPEPTPEEKYSVTYVINGHGKQPASLNDATTLPPKLPQLTADGYNFEGWYLDEALTQAATPGSTITSNTTLYAKWTVVDNPTPNPDPTPVKSFVVKFVTNCSDVVADETISENNKVSMSSNLHKEGYTLAGWYLDNTYQNEYDFNTPVTSNLTLYAKWVVSEYKVTFNGTMLPDVEVKHGEHVEAPSNPTKTGYTFVGWYSDNACTTVFDFENTIITKDTTIYALFKKINDSSDIDDKDNGSGTVTNPGDIEVEAVSGAMESGYITFKKLNGVNEYDYYFKDANGNYSLIDEKIAYTRALSSSLMRVDFTGLQAGSYEAMVLPHGSTTASGTTVELNVISYDRSGYAHFNYTSGVGAYNDNGTLKENAIVLYVTDENKNTIELTYGGTTVRGIGNILNSVGADVGGGKANNGGVANTNQGIIKKLGDANIPLVIRFVGCVSNTGLYKKGSFSAASKSLVEGLTIYDSYDNGGTPGDNGHMARIKSGKDITIEGLGSDATIDGWGFHFMAESSSPTLGKSFEVRNLTFINTPEDAIGMEGIQETKSANSKISASVERCWIHNNEFYGPSILNPAESDKSEGDGSCDFKRGQYLTVSYNYFEGCHKTNLVGSADYSLQFNLTYHHNYWKLCKARGPLTRRANVHMYNNLFEGQTDYAINTRADAYIFSESNMFYMCKNPFRVDGGAIKSYNDSVASALYQKAGATVVSNKTDVVSNNCQYIAGGIKYNDFDTNEKLSYIATGNYDIQTNVTDARKVIEAYCGVRKDSSISPKDVTMKDISMLPSGVTPKTISLYPTEVTPGKVSKTAYAFTLDHAASVTISYSSDTYAQTGVLVNEAGEALLTASGTIILEAGTYMIQPVSFQPGDSAKMTKGTFKEITINSIKFEEYNSEELNQKLIKAYNDAVAKIPDEIKYDDKSLNAIKHAMNCYNALKDDQKATVSYEKVEKAYKSYISLGKTHVEELIDAIGEVNENSGDAISTARSAYNSLKELDGNVQISNYNILVSAEDAFDEYAVIYCINSIDNIGEVTLRSENLIQAARAAYNALDDDQKSSVTNYSILTAAEKKYNDLVQAASVNEALDDIDLTNLNDMKSLLESYDNLSSDAKQYVNSTKISEVKTTYLVKLIDSIGTVTSASGKTINEALNLYDTLTTSEKALITNYQTLLDAKTSYDEIAAQAHKMTFENGKTDPTGFFTITNGNIKSNVTKEYNGVKYTNALKIEKDTVIKFNAAAGSKLTMMGTKSSKRIYINGKEYKFDSNGILTVELPQGEITITKYDSTEIFAFIVE